MCFRYRQPIARRFDSLYRGPGIAGITEAFVKEKHLTALMVTHNLKFAIEYGNRLIMMHKGNMVIDAAYEKKDALDVDDLLNQFNQISIEVGN